MNMMMKYTSQISLGKSCHISKQITDMHLEKTISLGSFLQCTDKAEDTFNLISLSLHSAL